MKRAILVVSFGSTHIDTLAKTIEAVEKAVQDAFSEYCIYRAFTSQIVITRLKQREKINIDTIQEAMERIKNKGFEEVIVQPTHIIHGYENDNMMRIVESYADGFPKLRIGKPILSDTCDYLEMAEIFSAERKKTDDYILLAGHGTSHFANASYAALNYYFYMKGLNNIFVSTVEGYPGFDAAIKYIKQSDARKIKVFPFMLAAGEHVKKDICGSHKDSLKSLLLENGYEVYTELKGLGEYEEIRHMIIRHIQEAEVYTPVVI